MKIIPFAQQALRKLALIGLLFSPFILTPSYATELVGKPVAVGKHAAVATSSSAVSSQVQAEANQFEHFPDAPVAPTEPEPPQAPSELAQDEMQHAMDEMRDNFDHDMPQDFGGIPLGPDTIIPIVAMLLLFGGPVLLVVILAILHYRNKARRQRNINMNIDKLLAAGRDIPVELLLGEETAFIKTQVKGETVVYERNNVLLEKGVKNICVGIGLLIFLTIFLGIKLGSCAFIVIGLGISRLIIWKLSDQKTETLPKTEAVRVQD
jgi:hypothetical protein